ncbi:hypothetical protein ACT3TZ_00620 [Brachybacterium sp. AOP25-B2-12]|uniref:hypothetical protein n=1 Tax=Brachybacterium sp. AOP25-B2-12 TaxID=3457710 RepID=UPI0040341CEB
MKVTSAIIAAMCLVSLNLGYGAFYVLWSIADQAAVARSEAGGGFDPSQLLPYGNVMWVLAQLLLLAILVLDVVAIVLAIATWAGRRNVGRAAPSMPTAAPGR